MNTLAHVKPCELRGTLEQPILSQDIHLCPVTDYENYCLWSDGVVIGARGSILKEDENSTGYKRITLCKNGITKRVFVHKLVAEHFVEGYLEGMVVNHKDGNHQNNDYRNLEWVTPSENVKDGWKRGRKKDHLVLNFKRM